MRVEQHDLSESFPDGMFDLISANFLQTPFEFPWEDVIRRAAGAIRPGGLLLAVTHERVAPWSWSDAKLELPGAEERLADLALRLTNPWLPLPDTTTLRQFTGSFSQVTMLGVRLKVARFNDYAKGVVLWTAPAPFPVTIGVYS